MRLIQSLAVEGGISPAPKPGANEKPRVESASRRAFSLAPSFGGQEAQASPPPGIVPRIKLFDTASPRLAREWQTMQAMIYLFCRDRHSPASGVCDECHSLMDYAAFRLERCRYGAEKPTCANCPVHCYQRVRRDQIKAVMRHAGPRMLWKHPLLSLRHWLDGFRRAPQL